MATQRISILGPEQGAPARKAAGSLRLPPTMNNDVFLNALLEMPTTQQTRRSPLKWLSAMGFHIVIVAALIIVPLYTTRSEEHTSELQSRLHLVCRLLLEKKKNHIAPTSLHQL